MPTKLFALSLSILTFFANVSALFANDEVPSVEQGSSLSAVAIANEFVFIEAPFASCHASTIAETLDRTFVVAWFAGTREGAGDVAIWSSTFRDGRWNAPKVVGDADEENVPCWNPVLHQQKSGALCLFYKIGKTIAGWRGVVQFSDDNGETWRDRRVLPEGFLGPIKNKPVELDDGTILAPSSSEDNGWRVHMERIPAFDKTWSRTAPLNEPSEGGAIQPSVLFHRDGRLQAICRNQDGAGTLWYFWSNDDGNTWSRMEPSILPNPCSGTDAVTLQDGRQLLVYNHSNVKTGGRNVLNVAVSDDGVSWKAVCVLENDPNEYSYPAVIQARDGAIQITYTWRRERIKRVVLDPKKIVGVPIVDGVWPASVR